MTASAHVELPAKHGDRMVTVLVDLDDFERLAGRRLSIGSHGYAQVYDHPAMHLLHRWLLDLRVGDGLIGDHHDRDVLDCRRSNLRVIDPSTSNVNRGPSDASTVGAYRLRSGRWQAKVQWRNRRHHLGTFDTQGEALAAVRSWRERHDEETRSPRLIGASA